MKDALEYEQISDELMILDLQSASLRFNVKLFSKSANGSGENFHKEFRYDSKYTNRSIGRSIRRSFTYFLTINGIKAMANNMPLQITIYDMLLFKAYLTNAYTWITSSNVFAIKDKKLIVISASYEILTMYTIYDKKISFEPVVLTKSNDLLTQGIRMIIDDNWVINIEANKFAGLLYLVDSIDMYNAAITLINYLPSPSFGNNVLSDFSTPMQQSELIRRDDRDKEDIPIYSPIKKKKSYKSLSDL